MARALPVVAIAALLVGKPALAEEVIDMEEPEESPTPVPEATAPSPEPPDDSDPRPIMLRRLVKAKGNLVASPNLLIGRNAYASPSGMTTATVTALALRGYAAAGFTDKITAGAAYAIVLSDGIEGTDFSARGPLTVFGSFELIRKGPLSIAVGGDLVLNFAGANDSTEVSVRGGGTVRFTVLKKVALYTGSPLAGTPQARQLSLGFYEGGRSTLAFPLGIAVQATPEVYAFVETTLAEIYFVNGPQDASGNTQNARAVFSDFTPLAVGAFYSTSSRMDLGGSLTFADLAFPEYLLFTFSARFHTGP